MNPMLDQINSIQELAMGAVILLPFVTGLVEVIKQTFAVQPRFIPGVSLVVGIVLGLLLIQAVIGGAVGAILGLAGTGLWEFGKNTVLNTNNTEPLG